MFFLLYFIVFQVKLNQETETRMAQELPTKGTALRESRVFMQLVQGNVTKDP